MSRQATLANLQAEYERHEPRRLMPRDEALRDVAARVQALPRDLDTEQMRYAALGLISEYLTDDEWVQGLMAWWDVNIGKAAL